MNNLDNYCHILGIEFLTILGMVWLLLDEQPIQRTVSILFLLLLGVMMTHAMTHLLPNAIAKFIYSSHHSVYSKNVRT